MGCPQMKRLVQFGSAMCCSSIESPGHVLMKMAEAQVRASENFHNFLRFRFRNGTLLLLTHPVGQISCTR